MPQDNFDVDQMQADFAAQQNQYYQGYADQQATLTGNRASYGDVPAMMMSGMQSAGGAFMGAAHGAGSMMSGLGSMIAPSRYMAPARVSTGYYGQYAQNNGFFQNVAAATGHGGVPRGANAYQYGYHSAADLGNRAGGLAVSTIGVTAGLLGGAPVGGAIGAVAGGMLGAAFGPVGMGVGAAIGGFAGNIGGYMAVDSLGDAVAQRREINSFLESSSFRYVGAGSSMADPRMGGGMGFESRRGVTDYMKQLDLKDPTMGMGDLSNVLQGATSMGLFSGSGGDIESFKKRFKDVVDGVKVISKTLNTTLEEGLQFMKDFRAIGVDPSQMGGLGLQASSMGKVAGRTAQEMVGMGLQSAELFRGTGVEMKVGYQAGVMNLASIRSARDAGMISQEAIVQAGGEEAMAQRMVASGLQFSQSAFGRGYGATYYSGQGPGGFNAQGFAANMGQGSVMSHYTQGAQNLASPGAVVGYTVNQDQYISEMGKSFGGRGLQMAQLDAASKSAATLMEQGVTSDRNVAMKYSLMSEQNLTSKQADELMNIMKNAPKEFSDKMMALRATEIQNTVDESYRTKGFHARYEQAKDKISGAFEPFVRSGDRLIDKGKELAVEAFDSMAGVTRYDLSGFDVGASVQGSAPGARRSRIRKAEPLLAELEVATAGMEEFTGDYADVSPIAFKIRSAIQEGKITRETSTVDMVKAVTGGKKPSPEQYARIKGTLKALDETSRSEAGTLGIFEGIASSASGRRFYDKSPAFSDFSGNETSVLGALRQNLTEDIGESAGNTVVDVSFPNAGGISDLTKGRRWGSSVGGEVTQALKTLGRFDMVLPKKNAEAGDIVLSKSDSGGVTVVNRKEYGDLLTQRRASFMTEEEAQGIKDSGLISQYSPGQAAGLVASYGKKATLPGLVEGLWGSGTKIGNLSSAQRAYLVLEGKNDKGVAALLEGEKEALSRLDYHAGAGGVESRANIGAARDELGKGLGGAMGLSEWGGVSNFSINAKSMELLYRAKLTTDPSIKAQLVGESITAAGVPKGQAGTAYNQFAGYAGMSGYSAPNAAVAGHMAQYGALSDQATSAILEDSAKSRIGTISYALGQGSIPNVTKSSIIDKATKLYTGKAQVDEYMSLDESSDVGKGIAGLPGGKEIYNVKAAISAAMGGKGREPLSAALDKTLLSDDLKKRTLDIYSQKGGKEAASALANYATLVPGMERGAHGPGLPAGASKDASGTNQGSAAEITQQQVNINLEVLEALRALNSGRR